MARKPSIKTAFDAKASPPERWTRTGRRKSGPLRGAAALVVSALTVATVATASAAAAEAPAPLTVRVDFASDAGAADHVGSGFLHGIDADGPPAYLIDGVDVRTIRGADHHPILPSLFDEATYDRVAGTGAKLQVGVYYYKDHEDDPRHDYRPGDNGDWVTWADIVTEVHEEAVANNYEVDSWITWNEPNLQWNTAERTFARYLQAHDVAYDTLKALDPDARVQGPELSGWNFSLLTQFLSYCKENGCLPDVLSWHELSQTPTDIPGHLSMIREWMVANGINPMPVTIDEYQGSGYGSSSPWNVGKNVRWMAQIERSVQYGLESANFASWEWPGEDPDFKATLSMAADRATGTLPRGVWWNLNAYKDMTGRMVTTTSPGPPFPGPDQTLQAEDAAMFGAQVATNWSGYTGTGFWNPLHASGDWAEWNVDVASAGEHTLIFRYANGGTTNRPMSVAVNGSVVATPAFAPTGGWSTWKYQSVVVHLEEGNNAVRITNTGSRGPNVDYLGVSAGQVSPSDDPAPVDAFSAVDRDLHRAVALVGNQTTASKQVDLQLANIPAELVNNGAVHVRATLIPNAETLTAPSVVMEQDLPATGGEATMALDLPAEASYRVDVTPAWKDLPTQRVELERANGFPAVGAHEARLRDQGASGGAAVSLKTDIAGVGMSWKVRVSSDGAYQLNLGGQSSNHNGMAQVYVDGVAVGGPLDQFATASSFFSTTGGVVQLTKGTHDVEIRAVGQNPQSAARDLVLDYVDLIRIGD
ncbi:carbohydrate-binding protein [Microbacterium trichothecenolyticum]